LYLICTSILHKHGKQRQKAANYFMHLEMNSLTLVDVV